MLTERIKQLEARAKQKHRKQETRRKVLLGALLASWMQKDAAMAERVAQALPHFLKRQVDRDVFDLPRCAEDVPTASASAASEA